MIASPANGSIVSPRDLKALSGKRTAAAVRRWASAQGIRVKDGANGPWTTLQAINEALGVRSPDAPYRAEDIA